MNCKPLLNNNAQVRTVEKNGEPWFVCFVLPEKCQKILDAVLYGIENLSK